MRGGQRNWLSTRTFRLLLVSFFWLKACVRCVVSQLENEAEGRSRGCTTERSYGYDAPSPAVLPPPPMSSLRHVGCDTDTTPAAQVASRQGGLQCHGRGLESCTNKNNKIVLFTLQYIITSCNVQGSATETLVIILKYLSRSRLKCAKISFLL